MLQNPKKIYPQIQNLYKKFKNIYNIGMNLIQSYFKQSKEFAKSLQNLKIWYIM